MKCLDRSLSPWKQTVAMKKMYIPQPVCERLLTAGGCYQVKSYIQVYGTALKTSLLLTWSPLFYIET